MTECHRCHVRTRRIIPAYWDRDVLLCPTCCIDIDRKNEWPKEAVA